MSNLRSLRVVVLAVLAGFTAAACGSGVKNMSSNTLPDPEETPVATPVEPEQPVAEAERPPEPEPVEAPPAEAQWPEEDYRAKRPEVGAAREVAQPKIARFMLKNGIEVFLVERHALPTVSIDLTFAGGAIDDGKGKEGEAGLCMNLLDDGTEALDKIAFEEAQADIASSVGAYAGSDQQGVSASTLTKNLDRTLDLWADTLLHPGLRQEDHDRNVKQTVAGIQQSKGAPGAIGGRVFGSVFYGEAHPFGRITTETTATAVTLDDCKAYVKAHLAPQGAQLYVVGDITKAQIEEKIGGRLKDWKGKPKAVTKIPAAKPRKGRIFFVDVPNAPQSQIYLSHVGPARKAKDYFATRLMMAILGGGFSSRINMNIREDKGWAYGARGNIAYTRTMGTFTAAASVRADVTKGSIIEVYKEINNMISGDVTDEELKREKDGTILALPAQFATGSSVLGSFRGLIYFGLPLDYYASFVKSVQAVDKKAVKAAAKKNLKPKDIQILVVGDAKTVLPELEQLLADKTLGDGELVILDADGKIVPPAAP